MSHIPVNHHLRPLYRVLATLTGIFVLVFGIVGLTRTRGTDLFAHGSTTALGLRTNLAFSLLSIVAGAVIVVVTVIGRNLDHFVNIWGGALFLVAGAVMMLLMRTSANFLNFSMSTCIVSFLIGMALLAAGLYGKTGSPDAARVEEAFRHGGH
ncbi:MAG TPA: DUF4383 domain-containing protein [Micromonosporaceae bacterium]|jgi:hypothetical protein|nr:DUF4383 domain-containing protein [Micromonosporaceae bacterium]